MSGTNLASQADVLAVDPWEWAEKINKSLSTNHAMSHAFLKFPIGHGHYNRSSVFSIQSRFNTSLRASSPGRSGGGAGKGRKACNYVSGI